jgi:hypothetical protein
MSQRRECVAVNKGQSINIRGNNRCYEDHMKQTDTVWASVVSYGYGRWYMQLPVGSED